jgi:hypothetical protein
LHKGVANPPEGLDQTLLDILADLIAYATSGVAVLFQRAFSEAAVKPPKVDLDLPGYFAALDIPIRRITKRMTDAKDRKTVQAMYDEFVETGKVIKTLPADDKKIRALHCKQILRQPIEWLDAMPIRPIGTKHVPLPEHPQPVTYELKVVPVAKDSAALIEDRTPTITPDPEVFEEVPAADPILAAKPLSTPPPPEQQAVETASAAEAMLAELEAVDTPEPEVEPEPAPEPVEATAEPVIDPVEVAVEAPVDTPIEASEMADTSASEPESEDDASSKLSRGSPVVDAPSIGPKTAKRLEAVNIYTIGDLLDADVEETATALNVRYIKAKTLTDWQDQTRLMVDAPGLRVLDSQILVGAGIRNVDDLAKASAKTVLNAATSFLDTPQGARVLWGGENNVDRQEVEGWIGLAKAAQA